jgi:hypothetical protein
VEATTLASSVTTDFVMGDEAIGTAGTAEQIETTSYRISSLMIIAKDSNTGRIFYGGSDVASSTQRGLAAAESIVITGTKPFDITTIYVDCSVSGEGVDFVGVRA